MSKTQQPGSDPAPKPATRSTVILMLATLGGTTWRMFVPTLGGFAIGFWLDTQYRTGPWFEVLGVFLGSWLTVWLVYKQIKAIKK
jgi:hypothetical protein